MNVKVNRDIFGPFWFAMRYISPIALPDGLGEWLGAELEARGVESASLYARAVISILLQSDMDPDLEMEAFEPSADPWALQAAVQLELKLERQREKERENKRGRPRQKQQPSRNKNHSKSGLPMGKKEFSPGMGKRRPHSWNGDEEDLKRTAAIECLLSASDEKWPVESLVDELYARVKTLQLEGPAAKWSRTMGSSAPVIMPDKLDSVESTTLDSDSFTSVSSPGGDSENYFSAFPPLDTSSPNNEVQHSAPATVWAFPLQHREAFTNAGTRVPFVRVAGARLSPSSDQIATEKCFKPLFDNSEAYFGDCSSRDSSLERSIGSGLNAKGRLYQRGVNREDWTSSAEEARDIWAPCEKDWNLLGQYAFCSDMALDKLSDEAICAIQQSLAVLNHNPKMSSFAEVVPGLKYLQGSSKLLQWMGAVKRKVLEQGFLHAEVAEPEEEEVDNLLVSPKTHFCPIPDDSAENEVDVKDGATFDVDAHPDELHFLRSPSGALYLPEAENDGEWTKYMVYNPPDTPEELSDDAEAAGSTASPFPLKFRVRQTEKCCQTDTQESVAVVDALELELGAPVAPFLGVDDVWKFDAGALKEAGSSKPAPEDPEPEEEEEEEEEEGLLKEVFRYGAEPGAEEEEPEADLDELWNPLMAEGDDAYDVCEWVSQDVYNEQGEEFGAEDDGEWSEAQRAELVGEEDVGDWSEARWACPESWPPPYIPVEYLDDELFDEIFGSVDSSKTSNGGLKTEKKASRRRKRNSCSQKGAQTTQQHHHHRRRPCSFFVEGECLRPDCKFSHDLGSIPCRFWLEASCFKGDACPFMHAKPTKSRGRRRSYSQSDADAAADSSTANRSARRANPSVKKPNTNFSLDLENDFPSLSQSMDCKVTKSRPIPINASAVAATDLSASSVEGTSAGAKRRRRKPAAQRARPPPTAAAQTSSDSSPCVKKPSKKKNAASRQRSVSEQGGDKDSDAATNAQGRLRLSTSYKEG